MQFTRTETRMNEQDRIELEKLKRRQELLQQQLSLLSAHIESLDARLKTASEEILATPPPIPQATSIPQAPPMAVPPIIPPLIVPETVAQTRPTPTPPEPVPVAQTIETPNTVEKLLTARSATTEVPPVQPPPSSPPSAIPEPAAMASGEKSTSFEIRLGTFWLARIGIVVVLTGLVFLGNFAYGKFSPGGKISLLYFAGALLLGAGAWLQRKAQKDAVKNYGQVLFAGGLAAVYFTTYAAHHIESLRIIPNALVDGCLLLGWAGFIVWLADRKKSEVLALFAISLAYYSSISTEIALFTLYSNLVLTAAAVFFLIRNRWSVLSFVSLLASYGGFVFWRFYQGKFPEVWRTADLTHGNFFLGGYWILFTAAVFLSRRDAFNRINRPTFLSLNNAGFFALVILSMLHVNTGSFWKFSLGFGVVLLALAQLAKRIFTDEPAVKNAYLTQGLLLVTVGLIAYFTGLKLALVLAAESVALLVLSYGRENLILRAGAFTTALLATGWGILGIKTEPAIYSGAGIGALLAFNAFWSSRRESNRSEEFLRATPTFFSLLALLIWLATDWNELPREWFASALALESLVLLASYYLLRTRELAVLGQGYLILGQFVWLADAVLKHKTPDWWHPAILIASSLATSHWWQRQKALSVQISGRNVLQAGYALAVIALLFFWLQPSYRPEVWLAFSAVLALGITIYGVVTRSWALAICGQIFLFVSGREFVWQLLSNEPVWYFALVPIVVLLITALLAGTWFAKEIPESPQSSAAPLLQTSLVYVGIALAMSLWWVHEYIPVREQVWVFSAAGIIVFLLAGWRRSRVTLFFGAIYFAASFAVFFSLPMRNVSAVYWPNLLSILAVLALQQFAKRHPENYPLKAEGHWVMIVAGALVLWLFLSRFVLFFHHENYLAVSWSLLALLFIAAEFLLQEKIYQWLGFAVLAVGLGFVMLHEIWSDDLFWPNVVPLLLWLALQQLARRQPEHYKLQSAWHTSMIAVGGVSLWILASRWTDIMAGGHFYLTVIWAALALIVFVAGFGLRERVYRWLGLGILACAVGRVFFSDVWRLEILYRILSFLALGVVLLALGFIYNKYQEKIKEWL